MSGNARPVFNDVRYTGLGLKAWRRVTENGSTVTEKA